MSVFPNPSSDFIQFLGIKENSKIETAFILDVSGKVLKILHDEDLKIFVLPLSHNTSYYFFGNDLRESQFICKKYSFSNIPHLNYEKISFQQFLDKTNNSFSIHNKNYKISFSIPYFAKIFNKIVYSGNQHLIQYILDNIHLFLPFTNSIKNIK